MSSSRTPSPWEHFGCTILGMSDHGCLCFVDDGADGVAGPCFVVVVGDKGHPTLANVVVDADGDDPYVAKHGSVSVSVSFHMFTAMFERHVADGFCLLADPSPRYVAAPLTNRRRLSSASNSSNSVVFNCPFILFGCLWRRLVNPIADTRQSTRACSVPVIPPCAVGCLPHTRTCGRSRPTATTPSWTGCPP